MTLLQPWMLYALPLALLPVLLHLLNRTRHRRVAWAAIRFLQQARRRDRGRSRLRRVLILLARVLALLFLLAAAGRPLLTALPSGWGWDRPDATLVLLDRSPSMERAATAGGPSRRELMLERLGQLLGERSWGRDLVLVDGADGSVRILESPADLTDPALAGPLAAPADLPAMLESAEQWLTSQEVARADLWICTDSEAPAWDPESGRWPALRERLAERKGLSFLLMELPEGEGLNHSVRVERALRRPSSLLLDLRLHLEGGDPVPVEARIGGQAFPLEVQGGPGEAVLRGVAIPLDEGQRSGWGEARLLSDANPADDRFYFVFAEPPARRSLVATRSPELARALAAALEVPSAPGTEHEVEIRAPEQAGAAGWEGLSLLVWQGPPPGPELAGRMEDLARRGGMVLVLAPDPGEAGGSLGGASWGEAESLEGGQGLSWWRDDADLLASTADGEALPLQEIRCLRFRPLDPGSGGVPLARLEDGRALLQRRDLGLGSVYHLGTLPVSGWSNLRERPLGLFVMLQRILERGAEALGEASHREAGASLEDLLAGARRVAPPDASGERRGLDAGVFEADGRWIAVNRSVREDGAPRIGAGEVDELFGELPLRRVGEGVPASRPLAREIWPLLFLLLLGALVLESVLCLPPRPFGEGAADPAPGG